MLDAPSAPGVRVPGPARPRWRGPPTALAHAACSSAGLGHITSLHTDSLDALTIAPEVTVCRHLEKVCGHSPPRPGASCAGRLSLDTAIPADAQTIGGAGAIDTTAARLPPINVTHTLAASFAWGHL